MYNSIISRHFRKLFTTIPLISYFVLLLLIQDISAQEVYAKNGMVASAHPLATKAGIERDSQSDTTISLVNRYVKEAIQKLPEMKKPIYVSYNCTHYGYVDDLFRQAFKSEGVNVVRFLDPNPLMADFIFESENLDRYPATEVSIRVVSQPELPPGKLASIYSLIEPHSSQTAEALLAYTFEPDYFEWRSIADIKSKN